jgi:hypothetical protein
VASIDGPVVPLRLYRYRSLSEGGAKILDREVRAIKEKYLWCSNFSAMNDPMEGFYRPSSVLKRMPNYASVISRLLVEKKEGIGIACFSETKDSELMWTHYAGNYTGICVAYSTKRLAESLPDDVSLVRLGYVDEPLRVSSPDTKNIIATCRKILSQKKYNWSYEREWRVLGPVGAVPMTELCVTHVYFGSRVASAHVTEVKRHLGEFDIDFSKMEVSGYRHKWRKVPK